MTDLIYSIPTIILCTIGYYFSWRYYSKNNFAIAVLLLMVCGLALRIYTSSDFFLHPWDERYHALVAKNLINHPFTPTLYDNPILPYDYKNWTGNHIWVHKQPLPLWTMAASMWLFGINEIALPIRYMIERVKPFQQNNRNPDWAIDLRKLNDKKITNGVLFNYDKPIEAMFYTNLTAYQNIPDRNKIIELVDDGYSVIINDDGKLPEDIKTMKNITIEQLDSR